jgi:hypothetical protein
MTEVHFYKPDWVLIEAAKRCGWDHLGDVRTMHRANPTFRALCDMIERYEKPPVDRKVLCARQAMGVRFLTDSEETYEKVAVRAIELWEEGFEK